MADLRIPFALPDLRPGAEFLLGAVNQRRQRDTADRQAATQEEYARLGMEKLSAQAEREKRKFDVEEMDRIGKAEASAQALEDAGDLHGAERLRLLHGIKTAPVMGSPTQAPTTIVTPLQAMAESQLKQPESLGTPDRSHSYQGIVTPMQALGMRPDPSGSETARPGPWNSGEFEQFQGAAADASHEDYLNYADEKPPEATVVRGPEDSTAEQMPLTIPGGVEPGPITSAIRLTGPRGEDLGISDPEARAGARRARAQRISGALSPMSPELAAIASLEAEGDLSAKDYAPTVRAYTAGMSEQGRNTRSQNAIADRQGRQEDQQAFTMGENQKYKDTPDRRDARAFAVARIKAQADALRAEGKDRDADRMEFNSFNMAYRDWKKSTANVVADNKQLKDLHAAQTLLNSSNPQAQADGFEKVISIFRGGTATQASQELMGKHLSGVVGRVDTWLENQKTGGYGDEALRNLRNSVALALKENAERRRNALASYDAEFTNSNTLQNLAQPIAEKRNALRAEWGEQPSMTTGEEGPVLGPRGKGTKPSKPSGRLSDADAINLAKKRYAADPNDATAAAVLRKHGLLE